MQKPQEKINHGLVLGGDPGIGKDTLLEPVKYAVGPWNFAEVSPTQVIGRFNGFLKSVVLRISEAKDLGDVDRYKFYDHTKIMLAAPPDVLRIDEKHLREYYVFNVTVVVMTTNHKTNGIYLPADDRRHLVAWSDLKQRDFDEGYWNQIWHWYELGGFGHVAAYLAQLDLSGFDPKAPPPKTAAFWAIVDANRRAGGRRACRCHRQAWAPRRRDPGYDHQSGGLRVRLRPLAARPQEPARDPSPVRKMRLCPRAKPQCRRWALRYRWEAAGDIRKVYLSVKERFEAVDGKAEI